MNHGTYTTGLGENLQTKIFKSTQPFLLVIRTKDLNYENKIQTLCIFCNRTQKQTSETEIPWSKGSFIMVADDGAKNNSNRCTMVDK